MMVSIIFADWDASVQHLRTV